MDTEALDELKGIATVTDICRTLQKLKGLSDTVSDGEELWGNELDGDLITLESSLSLSLSLSFQAAAPTQGACRLLSM